MALMRHMLRKFQEHNTSVNNYRVVRLAYILNKKKCDQLIIIHRFVGDHQFQNKFLCGVKIHNLFCIIIRKKRMFTRI